MFRPTALRPWLLASLLLLASAFASAQSPSSSCPPPAPGIDSLLGAGLDATPRDRGFLWRLEKDGRVSWLYGTVHVNRMEWLLPGPRVQEALAGSEVLALELDPSDPELARAFADAGDPARTQRLTADLQPRLARLARRECLPPDSLAKQRPLLQLASLALAEARREGLHPELGVDAMLWVLAQQAGKPVVALETAAGQLALMSAATEADERELLQQGVADLESGSGRAMLRRLLQAWADGSEAELASYPQWCACLDTPAERRYLQRLNDDRNPAMAARLATLHAAGRPFFAAVGALHMTGPQALQELLRARGFQVQRVPPTPSR